MAATGHEWPRMATVSRMPPLSLTRCKERMLRAPCGRRSERPPHASAIGTLSNAADEPTGDERNERRALITRTANRVHRQNGPHERIRAPLRPAHRRPARRGLHRSCRKPRGRRHIQLGRHHARARADRRGRRNGTRLHVFRRLRGEPDTRHARARAHACGPRRHRRAVAAHAAARAQTGARRACRHGHFGARLRALGPQGEAAARTARTGARHGARIGATKKTSTACPLRASRIRTAKTT